MEEKGVSYRVERDPVGEKRVPSDALYGVQTLRARENFRVSPLRVHPALITAYAEIKQAAAEANVQNGKLEPEVGRAIESGKSVEEVLDEEKAGL